MEKLKIAVVSGSARPQRRSHQVALEVLRRLQLHPEVEPWLLDVKEENLPLLDYVQDMQPNPTEQLNELSRKLQESAGLVLVSPEHNGSYSGALKNTLDYFYEEYREKAFGVVGVSTGMLGGVSAARNLQLYGLRLNGIVSPHILITPKVKTLFEDGELKDEGYGKRIDAFLKEFLWLTKVMAKAPKKEGAE